MADETQNLTSGDSEEEIWIAIEAFEKILEAMPNDRASLEALSHAYGQVGDRTRSTEYLLKLGQVLVDEGDAMAASVLSGQLKASEPDDPGVKAMCAALDAMSGAVAEPASPAPDMPAPAAGDTPYNTFNLADELSFAWALMESEQLTQEEYSKVVQDLTEMSASDSASTVSVLHALEFGEFKGLERLLLAVSKEYGAPIMTLSLFNIPEDVSSSLPRDFMIRRGALVFEFIGDDALVVVMNPSDKQLQKRIESLTKRKCHFYMALPTEFDRELAKLVDASPAGSADQA
jgi:hypothetical protein